MIPKYRVWNRKSDTMYDPNEVIIQIKGSDILVALESSLHQLQDCSLMLSTGIKDINEVEVYEDDFVKDAQTNRYGIVCLGLEGFVIMWRHKEENIHHCLTEFEVVGNIYENTELLLEA
ncbi:YopX family protein [Staphylococcus chromogenes]|uniref:YopX family protein n=1 Tax=Staphylococcus chromogenes TaxID=46126 RepID=UPI002885660D|nr:YopX family protein [Staphylococcus chromogenes]MDT0700383.1 YopX family protein [Staphylococcus chromogenes]